MRVRPRLSVAPPKKRLSALGLCAPLTLGALLSCAFQEAALAQQAAQVPATPQTTPQNPPQNGLQNVPQAVTPNAPPGAPVFGGESAPENGPTSNTDFVKPPPFYIQAAVTSTLSWSNDGAFGTGSGAKSGGTLEVTPSVVVHDEGAQYRLDGTFALDAIASSDSENGGNRVLPRGFVDFNAALVQNLLYFDAGLRSARTTGDPFGITTLGPTTGFNEYTTNQYRIAPYVLSELTPDITLAARSENSWASTDEPAGFNPSSGYYGMQSVRVDRRPEPLGLGVELSSSVSRFENQSDDALKDDAARFTASYAFDPFLLGIIGGYERADVSGESKTHAIGGIKAEWRPNTRTSLVATVESRYFGTGWNVKLSHSNEDFALSGTLVRDVTTYPAVLDAQAGSGFVGTLLSSMLSSQFTNSTQRVAEVQNLLASTGIPADLAGASLVASAQALDVETATLNAVLLGKFNTLAFTIYRTRTVPFYLPGDAEVLTVPAAYIDNVISGATINWVHHLSPTWDVNSTLLRSNSTGLGIASGTSSKQTSLLVQLADRLSPRTTAFVGVRYQILDSTAATNANETAVFVGFTHRF